MDKTFNHLQLFEIVRIEWYNYVMDFNSTPIISRGLSLAIITDEVGGVRNGSFPSFSLDTLCLGVDIIEF